MKKITILHPFTPKAAGVVEKSVATYHSQPHLKALQHYAKEHPEGQYSIEYFTPKRRKYTFLFDGIHYQFYPVDFTWNGDHKKWKKQTSKPCLRAYKKNMPDVTIINMSGHSSFFSHQLAKEILKQKKTYIAMLGGQHYSDTLANREYYNNAHHVLVHTTMQKREMEKLPMFSGMDIRVFPLGVDTTMFQPKKQKEQTSAPQLLYVGRIVEWKQIHLAIEAVSLLVDSGFLEVSLRIIGPVSSENYLQTLQQLVNEKHLENNVEFLGHKEHAELTAYFQNADLLTLPSHKETFGMVMIEAMACGTPVAALDSPGGPADVITHLENGLLATHDTYSQTILGYFQNKERKGSMEMKAREKVLKEYSIDATYQVLKKAIETALHGN